MNFLRKFFGNKSNTATTILSPTIDTTVEQDIASNLLQDLFADHQPPTHQPPTINTHSNQQISKLQAFLAVNYSSSGFADGYEHQSTELLDRKISIYKAEFRQIVDETIDSRRQEVFQLRNQLIETRGLSERLVEQIELRIAELLEVISKLEKEKAYSAVEEGLVMKSIHQYREGFLRGCTDWHEAKLFAQSTGLY